MIAPTIDPFAGATGEMAALMRATDWSKTALGPAHAWPQSLRTIVRVLLTSRFAMWMGWGPDLVFLYNDAYGSMTLGAKHPWALGRPSCEVWAEIWPDIGPRIERVLRTGEATWDEDLLLFLERSGYREETYHTFSYSPITDDTGAVAGHLCVVTEGTDRVIGDRRMALLRDAAAGLAVTNTECEMFAAVERALAGSLDMPFTLTYLIDEHTRQAHLASRTGLVGGHAAAPVAIALDDPQSPWPIAQASLNPEGLVVDLADRLADLPLTPWSRPPTRALVCPIPQQGRKSPAGVFIAGLNPFRHVDAACRSFVGLFVGELAAGLANARAYEAERRRAEGLAAIDRAKTTFFSNVSHEFRTPLTLLLGPLDDIRRADARLPPEMKEQLAVAHRNGLRLLKLVNTLLDFSRIEAGRVRAHFERVDLGRLTADLASTFRSAMERAGLEFTVACEGLEEPVFLDREMWEKIVLNLISNAFKFTLNGRVDVSVSARDTRAVLTVCDTGAGIPGHELPRIFERFHRVEGTEGRSHEGSGIGLALVQELVKLHGGELSAESEPGRGSTFTVSIPFGDAHLPQDHVVARTAGSVPSAAASYVEEALRWLPDATESSAAHGKAKDSERAWPAVGRVLLADDNADMREYARRLLAERWDVVVACNGLEALEQAKALRPDAVVTDVMMPELDGFGLLRKLRADPDLAATPVIMLSARAGEEARLEGLAASADDYVVKPFSARDFLARVDVQIAKARNRLAEQRHAQRTDRLLRHAPVAIAVLNGPDHRFELTNTRFQQMIGNRDVAGKPIRDALPELAGGCVFEILDRVWASGEAAVNHPLQLALNPGRNGTQEPCEFDVLYQPVPDADNRVSAIVMIAHDVTVLAASKREAETANRLKDEFLATLSHELRTPLNAVLGYTQMVRGGVIQPARLPHVMETIERNAKLQEKLISDVLDVSRIITGKLRLDMRPVDLERVINDALETVAPAASAKGVRLQTAIDLPGVPVAGDAQRLQQVVWNLLTNAIKFTPRGGRVRIRLCRVNSNVELTVSDTGEGVAPDFLPHLFERFRQADSALTRTRGGLGLGLALSRHLVEAHGGRIAAASPGLGHGTTVRVQLPVMIVRDWDEEEPEGAIPAPDPLALADLNLADLTGRRVLLVDDDADALAMAKDALAAAGANVVTAASADEALQALDRELFDAAVLDIGMPDVDGYELLKRIRSRPAHQQSGIPAAALTAYARTVDRARSLRSGFQLHLSKPVQPSELAAAVLDLAGGVRSRPES